MKTWLRSGFVSLGLALAFPLSTAHAGARDPMGETASYKVDKNKDRTSSLIKDGTMETVVMEASQGDSGKTYKVDINYEINLIIGGKQKGTSSVQIPESYFTDTFWNDLRANGSYVTDKFKVKYLSANVTVSTQQGQTFENCDQVLVYDIPTKKQAIAPFPLQGGGLEDLEIVMYHHPSLPVLGAARMDARGTYLKQKIKMGADYTAD